MAMNAGSGRQHGWAGRGCWPLLRMEGVRATTGSATPRCKTCLAAATTLRPRLLAKPPSSSFATAVAATAEEEKNEVQIGKSQEAGWKAVERMGRMASGRRGGKGRWVDTR